MKDIVYINQGLFTAFIPQTTAGEAVFNSMAADTQGTGKVLNVPAGCGYLLSQHAKAIIEQIKQAGYTVGKAPKTKALTADDVEVMLRKLELE